MVVVVIGTPTGDSAESDEECSRPSVKSSKQIIVRCENSSIWKHYVVRIVRTVRTSDISCRQIADEWRLCQTQRSFKSLDLDSSEFSMLF